MYRNEHGQFAAWGNGKENDWGVAATTIGNILQNIDPDALIIGWSRHGGGGCIVSVAPCAVEGILSAGNLLGAYEHPVQLRDPSKLLYSGHIYPFSPVISDLPYNLFKCGDRVDTV